MDYHIARKIPQKHLKDNTLLYFADGRIGYIPSKVNVKDFCVVSDDLYEYGKYQYVDDLENIMVLERPNYTNWDSDLHSNNKTDFAIILYGKIGWGGLLPNGIFLNGSFYSKSDCENLDDKYYQDHLLSDSELAVVEEQYFSQLISFSYREITPELLIELHNIAEVKLSGLNIEDIINSFTITGWLVKDCKSGKDNDWTVDWAYMKSEINYSDSYIEHILPPQNYSGHTDACGYGIPAYFYRDDLDLYLKEKSTTLKNKARAMYSKNEHIMYIFHKLLSDTLSNNSKYLEYKEKVHDNYISYWHNGRDDKVKGNYASKKWIAANVFVNNKITDTNIREMIFEHNQSVKNTTI